MSQTNINTPSNEGNSSAPTASEKENETSEAEIFSVPDEDSSSGEEPVEEEYEGGEEEAHRAE